MDGVHPDLVHDRVVDSGNFNSLYSSVVRDT